MVSGTNHLLRGCSKGGVAREKGARERPVPGFPLKKRATGVVLGVTYVTAMCFIAEVIQAPPIFVGPISRDEKLLGPTFFSHVA